MTATTYARLRRAIAREPDDLERRRQQQRAAREMLRDSPSALRLEWLRVEQLRLACRLDQVAARLDDLAHRR